MRVTVSQFVHENRFTTLVKSWLLRGDLLDGPVDVELKEGTHAVVLQPPLQDEDGDTYEVLYIAPKGRLVLKKMSTGRTVLCPVESLSLSPLRETLEQVAPLINYYVVWRFEGQTITPVEIDVKASSPAQAVAIIAEERGLPPSELHAYEDEGE